MSGSHARRRWLVASVAGAAGMLAASSAWTESIVFLGNSITQHGPDASIQWAGNWGMAASRADLDYTSQTLALLQGSLHTRAHASVQSDYVLEHEFLSLSPDLIAAQLRASGYADIVVLQFGDNVDLADARAASQFGEHYAVLLAGLRAHFGASVRLLCLGKWWPSAPIEAEIQRQCQRADGAYVRISDLHAEPWGPASAERAFAAPGVGEHPGDRAMLEIAHRIVAALAGAAPP